MLPSPALAFIPPNLFWSRDGWIAGDEYAASFWKREPVAYRLGVLLRTCMQNGFNTYWEYRIVKVRYVDDSMVRIS